MSRRLGNHLCFDKVVYHSRDEAEQVIARWAAMGKLKYAVRVYACPLSGQYYHIGRARRAVSG